MYFYLIIIGSGPGGYVGLKTAIVEKEGVYWGCIPTKYLLKSAFNKASKYGIIILKYSISIEYLDYIQCTKVIIKTNIKKILDIIISGICPEGLEEIGITLNSTKHICVDKYYSTNVKGYYASISLGKAKLNDSTDGFIIIDENSGELLGCHMIGVIELIYEIVVARKLETTSFEFFKCLHPHPTISESVVEAITNAYNQCIHI